MHSAECCHSAELLSSHLDDIFMAPPLTVKTAGYPFDLSERDSSSYPTVIQQQQQQQKQKKKKKKKAIISVHCHCHTIARFLADADAETENVKVLIFCRSN